MLKHLTPWDLAAIQVGLENYLETALARGNTSVRYQADMRNLIARICGADPEDDNEQAGKEAYGNLTISEKAVQEATDYSIVKSK